MNETDKRLEMRAQCFAWLCIVHNAARRCFNASPRDLVLWKSRNKIAEAKIYQTELVNLPYES